MPTASLESESLLQTMPTNSILSHIHNHKHQSDSSETDSTSPSPLQFKNILQQMAAQLIPKANEHQEYGTNIQGAESASDHFAQATPQPRQSKDKFHVQTQVFPLSSPLLSSPPVELFRDSSTRWANSQCRTPPRPSGSQMSIFHEGLTSRRKLSARTGCSPTVGSSGPRIRLRLKSEE